MTTRVMTRGSLVPIVALALAAPVGGATVAPPANLGELARLSRAVVLARAGESAPDGLRAGLPSTATAFVRLRQVAGESLPEVFVVTEPGGLWGERGAVVDLCQSGSASLPPGEMVSWGVYDLLIPSHPGTASKIHMFGYRAALNWGFELAAWAEYRPSGSSIAVQTPVSRWAFRWSVANSETKEVELTIEELKTEG